MSSKVNSIINHIKCEQDSRKFIKQCKKLYMEDGVGLSSKVNSMISHIKGQQDSRKFIKQCKKVGLCKNGMVEFVPTNIVKKSYGWEFDLDNAGYEGAIDKIIEVVECILECRIVIQEDTDKSKLHCELIYDYTLDKYGNMEFKQVTVKPYEICMGVDVTGEALISDIRENANVLLLSDNRSRMKLALDSMMINWQTSCSTSDVEVYLLTIYNDLEEYKKYRQVKEVVYRDIIQTNEVLTKLNVEMSRRLKLLNDTGVLDIEEYNELHGDNKLSYVYVVMDELHDISMDDEEGDILDTVIRLSKFARITGIQLISLSKNLKDKHDMFYNILMV